MVDGLKAPLSWPGRFEASVSQAFMSCGFTNPSVQESRSAIARHLDLRAISASINHHEFHPRHRWDEKGQGDQ